MLISSLITFGGGLLCFLYGMYRMTVHLKNAANQKMKKILEKLLVTPQRGILMGMGITAMIQSSSAVTVMLIGMVHAGILSFPQTLGVLIGADIGTTATAWLISLIGIKNSGNFPALFQPQNFPFLFLILGWVLQSPFFKSKRHWGKACVGFGILLYGMECMSWGAQALVEQWDIFRALTIFSHPMRLLFLGLALTAIIQSSSAAIGILQSFSLTGMITGQIALPLIMGINVGTCTTAVLAALKVDRKAKRVAAAHVLIKIFGVVLGMAFYFIWQHFSEGIFLEQSMNSIQIAGFHTLFNVGTVCFLLPFCRLFTQFIIKIIPEKNQ